MVLNQIYPCSHPCPLLDIFPVIVSTIFTKRELKKKHNKIIRNENDVGVRVRDEDVRFAPKLM